MYLVGDKPDPTQSEFLFLALRDSTIIGGFKPGDTPVYLLDNEGNGKIAFKSEYFILPAWVVKRYAKKDTGNKEMLHLLNSMYETTLQADNGKPDAATLAAYKRFRTDNTLPNRHIACLLDNYQNVISQCNEDKKRAPADVCIPLVKQLAKECVDLWGVMPPIVCVFMGEALLSANMTEAARKHFAMSLKEYPESVPIQVYSYRLERNERQKKALLKQLKKEHPKHLMVLSL